MKVCYLGNYRTECVDEKSGKKITMDGMGNEVTPTDLVAISLGSCVLTLVGMRASKCRVSIEGAYAEIAKTMTEGAGIKKIAAIHVDVFLPPMEDALIREELEEAGRKCPVHHSLHPDIQQTFLFHWASV